MTCILTEITKNFGYLSLTSTKRRVNIFDNSIVTKTSAPSPHSGLVVSVIRGGGAAGGGGVGLGLITTKICN